MDDTYEVDNRKRELVQRCSELVGQMESVVLTSPEDVEDLMLDLIAYLGNLEDKTSEE
jgi:hypothetical protein